MGKKAKRPLIALLLLGSKDNRALFPHQLRMHSPLFPFLVSVLPRAPVDGTGETPNTSYLVLVLPLGKGHEVHFYQLCSTHFLANYGNVSHCALLLEHRQRRIEHEH